MRSTIEAVAPARTGRTNETDDARALFRWLSALFASILVVVLAVVLTRRPFAYAVDDAYIHLTLARNLAFHGTWGLVPGVFESASSSPGWIVVLAVALRVWPFGAESLPLVLNVAAAFWLLHCVSVLLSESNRWRFDKWQATFLALPVVCGLVPLVLTGMEHTLHAAIVMQLLVLLQRQGSGSVASGRHSAWYAALAAGTFVRLETVMVAVAACAACCLLDRVSSPRRRAFAVTSAIAVAVPIGIIACLDLLGGGYPLPNSITAKSTLSTGKFFDLGHLTANLAADPALVLLACLCALVVFHASRAGDAARGLGALTVALTIAGLELFGSVGIFGRYEAFAYLAALSVLGAYILSGAVRLRSDGKRRLLVAVAVIVTAPEIALLVGAPTAMSNIDSQQAAMGRFLATYFDGQGVAVNDIGEVGFRHRGELVDFEGLGSIEVLRQRREGVFDSDAVLRDLAEHDVRVVVVFERFYSSVLPPNLVRVGTWCLGERVLVNGDRCVTWFATSQQEAVRLSRKLADFRNELPRNETLALEVSSSS